jgi:hypothetical protein
MKEHELKVLLSVTDSDDGKKTLGELDVIPNVVKMMGDGGVCLFIKFISLLSS